MLAALEQAGHHSGVLVIYSGLELPQRLTERLASLATSSGAPRLAVLPGNYHPALNPLVGMKDLGSAADIDSLIANAGSGGWLGCRLPEGAVVYLRPSGSDRSRAISDIRQSCALIDDIFIHDPTRPLDSGQSLTPLAAAAFGSLRQRLTRLSAEQIERLPPFGLDGLPVTLHIAHAWGGGIARWISDQCEHDPKGHHLVLAAAGLQDGKEHGQWLKLYARSPGQGLLREWVLTPPIADSVERHAEYARILNEVVGRYAVGRIIVSSLIGHSLDCLQTGLPTLQVLHDFYPLSPLLHVDPLQSLDDSGSLDLGPTLVEHRSELMFVNDHPEHWHRLGRAWAQVVNSASVSLVAPTRHVAERWQRVFAQPLGEIGVIGHGFHAPSDWTRHVRSRPRADGRLSLVIVGRLSSGKGLNLLDQALEDLSEFAHLTLVGAGREAERFFGRPGIDIVIDYQADELPDLLRQIGPDGALFLSTVPETWNYVLSEVRYLGLTPLATRLGSFVERINDGRDGVLFDPEPGALVAALKRWQADPEGLRAMAANAPSENDVATVAARYRRLLSETPAQIRRPDLDATLSAQLGTRQNEATELAIRVDTLAGQIDDQRAELDRRADWAERAQRLAEERTAWARSLDQELAATRKRVARQVEELDQRASRIDELDHAIQVLTREREIEREIERERLADRDHHLALITSSLSWRLTRPLRVLARLGRAGRAVRVWNPLTWPRLTARLVRSLRLYGLASTVRSLYKPPPAPPRVPVPELPPEEMKEPTGPPEPVQLVAPELVQVSIIIPVYNKVELTSACLNSLLDHRGERGFEVIVVDDCSSDITPDYLAECQGIRVLRNTENAGFIDSCNRGAAAASGEYLVFLNNDTTVTPGWLEALIAPFERDPETGIVGARLVYPDGRLQEAGGIIFNDGSGWNYGRGDDPTLPQYQFLSEADYVSGACLAIRRDDFHQLGGFDQRYRPAYYEDTDLCFQIRAAGKKVIYQPACMIVHHEGATSGTDESSGTKRYQAVNREQFLARWQAVLADHPPSIPDAARADPVRHWRFRRLPRRVLVIDAVTPQPDHDSGSVRITAMMELLIECGYQVSFMPENRQYVEGYTEALQQSGIEVLHAPMVADLEPWLQEHGKSLDMVVVSRHYVLAPILRMLRYDARQAQLVLDTVDLHFLREQREAELTGDVLQAEQAQATRDQELAMIGQADISLVVSPVEQKLLADLVPKADVRILSNIHSVSGSGKPWKEREGLLFVGGFQHQPNVDAAIWLVNEIYPRIRERLPDVVLHLIGSRMPDEVRDLQGPGVQIHGFVADLQPWLDGSRVSVAPLRYGAGVKGKVNQAMSHGLPVVATTCAAEGMFLEHGQDVLVADTAEAFAAEVVRLYQNEELWIQLSRGGLANVEQHFSRAAARSVLADIDAEIRTRLPRR